MELVLVVLVLSTCSLVSHYSSPSLPKLSHIIFHIPHPTLARFLAERKPYITLSFNHTYYLFYSLFNTFKMDKIKEVSHQDPYPAG